MNPIAEQAVKRILGDLIRKGVTVFGAWLAAKGLGVLTTDTQSNLVEILVGGLSVLGMMGWSYWNSRNKDKTINSLAVQVVDAGEVPVTPKGVEIKTVVPLMAAGLFSAFMAMATIGCAVMSSYDQNSYNAANALKVLSLSLLEKAGEPASKHAEEIASLKAMMSAQLAYEEGKGKANTLSYAQWKILFSPDHYLLGGTLKEWESGKKFSPAYLEEKKKQISDGFNEILKLEGRKTK